MFRSVLRAMFGAVLAVALLAPTASALTFGPAAPLTTARSGHQAVLLGNGKVLVIGGVTQDGISPFGTAINTAELYDPATNAWSPAGSLTTGRIRFTTTLLQSGKVLVAGGFSPTVPLDSAELYDPATNAWTPAGTLSSPRAGAAAALLANGEVLVAGGASAATLATADLYDPATNSWSKTTGDMAETRQYPTATRLAGGKVLVVGGNGPGGAVRKSADVFDPATGTFSGAGSLTVGRNFADATLLPSGKVLLTGGSVTSSTPTGAAELYDPATNGWTDAATGVARTKFQTVLLSDGSVLTLGGNTGSATTGGLESYNGAFSAAGALLNPREDFTATVLSGDRILVTGGANASSSQLKTTEIAPPLPTATPTATATYTVPTVTPTATVTPTVSPTPTATPTPPPAGTKVTGLKVKPKRLKTAKQRKAATVRFKLSSAATVKVTVARKVKKKFKIVRKLTIKGKAGANKKKLKAKKFKPGHYRLTLKTGTVTKKVKFRVG